MKAFSNYLSGCQEGMLVLCRCLKTCIPSVSSSPAHCMASDLHQPFDCAGGICEPPHHTVWLCAVSCVLQEACPGQTPSQALLLAASIIPPLLLFLSPSLLFVSAEQTKQLFGQGLFSLHSYNAVWVGTEVSQYLRVSEY